MKRKPSKGKGYRDEPEKYFSVLIGATDLIAKVYVALRQIGIPFFYSYYFGDALFTVGIKEKFRVHFYLPDPKVAIIVRGGYFYDSVGSLKGTALQAAMLEYAGVKTVVLLENDIIRYGANKLLMDIPEIRLCTARGKQMELDYNPLPYKDYYHRPSRGFSVQRQVNLGMKRRVNWKRR